MPDGRRRDDEDENGATSEPYLRLGGEDPFSTPKESRRSDRRLRGRLVAPVTIWTASSGAERAGLTVSSLIVAEGDSAVVVAVVDPMSDLCRLATESGRFIVHVLGDVDDRSARLFAGTYPVDPFDQVSYDDDPFGPLLAGGGPVARCRFAGTEALGFQALVRGEMESAELPETVEDPLVWYRGSYRRLA